MECHAGEFRWDTEPDGPDPGPKLSIDSRVLMAALKLATSVETPEDPPEWASYAKLIHPHVRNTGQTVNDFYNHSYPALVVAAAFDVYTPDEGPDYVTSVAIAEAARTGMSQVRMCLC